LRSATSNALNAYDKHPERSLKDMILHYHEVFLAGHLKPIDRFDLKSPKSEKPDISNWTSPSLSESENKASPHIIETQENMKILRVDTPKSPEMETIAL
jgi:hypothetical protein